MSSTRAGAAAIVALSVAAAALIVVIHGPARPAAEAATPGALTLSAPLPDGPPPPGASLVIGDPMTQRVLERTGWIRRLPFKVTWAAITGGPAVTEAFHARVLDVGAAADIPPIHATWLGMPVRIIAVRLRRDPWSHPLYEIATSPKSGVRTLSDLRGKRIAFSPGQVQGEVVLRTLAAVGLTRRDVTLVELPSTGGDLYANALAGGVVDAAPIGAGLQASRYLAKYGAVGGRVLPHAPFRDDLTVLYVRAKTLEDPAKAAALRAYVQLWARAAAWEKIHPAELARAYYVDDQGLAPAEAAATVAAGGEPDIPTDWSLAIGMEQAAADVMARDVGRPRLDAAQLFDRRFEHVAAEAAASEEADEGVSRLAAR